jgi:ABC-type glycerol-3-phosphate transport system substrate-binding protein
MKFKKSLAIISVAALLTVGCTQKGISEQAETQTPTAVESPVATVTANTSQGGTFKDGEHPTQGTVKVVTEAGKRFLEFDNKFKTSNNGPDLFVILHRSDAPPIYGIKQKDYVSIARLQKTSGSQRYALPDNVNLADFKSVVVWCRQFNATFGFAPLVNA